MNSQLPLIFFDNECLLCSRSVQWLIRKDKKSILQFAPLQGETARNLLPSAHSAKMNTLILWNEGNIYLRSQAVFKILSYLEKPWSYLSYLAYFPKFISDFFYRIIARFRKRLFSGNASQCLISQQHRILP
jgi:predicted DCC family thiol-disulfide oxidoreductase YuxK